MSNPERVSPKATAVRERRATSELTSQCSQCNTPVDPLRAARVRIIDDRFHYFCSATCAEEYEPHEQPTPHPLAQAGETRRRSEPSPPVPAATTTEALPIPALDSASDWPDDSLPGATPSGSPGVSHGPSPNTPPGAASSAPPSSPRSKSLRAKRDSFEPSDNPDLAAPPLSSRAPGAPREPVLEPAKQPLTLLLQVSVVASALSILFILALEGPTTNWIRLSLAAIASALQGAYFFLHSKQERDAVDGSVWWSGVSLVAGVATIGLGVVALLANGEQDHGLVSITGTQHLLWGVAMLMAVHRETPLENIRLGLAPALERQVLRISGEQTSLVGASELRPGEDIVVHAGEVLPVDAAIIAGSGEASPWLGSEHIREVATGDTMYAGAKLVSGQVRAVVRWTGHDRHWLRLTTDPTRRADRNAPSVLFIHRLLSRVGIGLVGLAAALSWSQGHSTWVTLGYALAAASVVFCPALPRLVRVEALHATLTTLEHGIVIANAKVLDIAGKISRCVFCARGTLLLGEPQLSTLEPLGSLTNEEILSLVAGAEQSSSHPIATSVLRAARAAGVLPDATRNPRSEAGLGVTALAADGRSLVVGSRALMLRERVSVARAEARITELEATGRTVLLMALGGHLSAILSFQDGLRKGARAAVQHLLDAGIEPVLLSGDSRDTCEALAKTLDIEHVRPDVLPAERGKEVERLRGGGAAVAVVGRSPADDLPLASASLSIALPSQGLQAGGFDIDIASDEVQNASLALRILHEHRTRVQRTTWLLFGGGVVATFGGVALVIPAAWTPFVALCCLGALWLLNAARQPEYNLEPRRFDVN
jgi:Cu+-exporting ATPase